MKKVYQIVAVAAMSMLVANVNGQVAISQGNTPAIKKVGHAVTAKTVATSNNSTDRVMNGSPANGQIDNVNADMVVNPNAQFYYWSPLEPVNSRYTLADTGTTSPYNSNTANANTVIAQTVVYDTMFDDYLFASSNQAIALQTAPWPGSVIIDSISMDLQYHNISGQNDTLVFQIIHVDTHGMPTTTVYDADTVIVNATSFTTNNGSRVGLSFQLAHGGVPAPIHIPASARRGWNFGVNFQMFGPKTDTVSPLRYSQGGSCGGFGYTPIWTSIGVPDGKLTDVNSFETGFMWWNWINGIRAGTPVTWPDAAGLRGVSGNQYYPYQVDPGCAATDTDYLEFQDIAIYPDIMYSPEGINEIIINNDFSVGQNTPNPFNQATKITYTLNKEESVVFAIHDVTGRELVNTDYSTMAPGMHAINLQANQFTPGIYFYTFNIGGTQVTKKMIITQ